MYVGFNNKFLSREQLSNFIDIDLNTNVISVDFSNQKECDNDILSNLANNTQSGAIRSLNFMSTNITYNGIVKLWNSSIIGSLVSDLPTYERYTGVVVSIIEVEIGNTPCYKQYQHKLFKYPLPLLRDFEITYGHRCIGEVYNMIGYKQIKLLDHGKELENICI